MARGFLWPVWKTGYPEEILRERCSENERLSSDIDVARVNIAFSSLHVAQKDIALTERSSTISFAINALETTERDTRKLENAFSVQRLMIATSDNYLPQKFA